MLSAHNPFFQGRLILDPDSNLIPENSPDLFDNNGHGSHIASIILQYSYSKILPLKMADVNYSQSSPLLSSNGEKPLYVANQLRLSEAIFEAIHHGVKIINVSAVEPDINALTLASIMVAKEHGIIIVAAAGNEGTNLDYVPKFPCSYSQVADNVVCVGSYYKQDYESIDSEVLRTPSSNYGRVISVFANGNSVYGAQVGQSRLDPSEYYHISSGTSQATAKISGLIAQEIFDSQIKLLNIPSLDIFVNISVKRDYKSIINAVMSRMKKSTSLQEGRSLGLYFDEKN